MTVTFTGRLTDQVWGTSRRWNAWVEIHVGTTMVASSANQDFAVLDGKVTEDISRSIRRDVQLTLLFPQNPQRRTVTAFTLVASGSAFTVGDDEVGGTDEVGGASASTQEESVPAVESDTARSVFVPTQLGDILDPHSLALLKVYAGFDGDEVLLGYFDLADTRVAGQAGGSVVEITGHSFERRLELAGFWQMEPFAADYDVTSASIYLVREVLPGHDVIPTYGSATIGELTWKPGDNRLTKINDMLAIGGLEASFSRNNTYVIGPSPTTEGFGEQTPRWEMIDGLNARIATLNEASRMFSDNESFNGVVAEGTGSTEPNAPPIFAARWNLNPSSPLYFDPDRPQASAMGPRPKHITSDLIKNYGDAFNMATVELAKVLMVSDTVDVGVPANAELEMGQFARLVCDALGVDEVYRISRVTHDLAGGDAQVSLYRFTAV